MPVRSICLSLFSVLAFSVMAVLNLIGSEAEASQPTADRASAAAKGDLIVPPLPQGTPEELLAFAEGLLPPKQQPKSREAMMVYIRDVARVSIQAADSVLGQVRENDPLYVRAARLKLEGLSDLWLLDDKEAPQALDAFASAIATSKVAPVAMEGKRMLIVTDTRKMFASEDFGNAKTVIAKAAELLASDLEDTQTAMMAMNLISALEQSGDSALAASAMKTLGPLFTKSRNEKIRELGNGFEAKLRLLELPGTPMKITGTLLDGTPFDQKQLAGKVVLVDFWATWCGPCIAEMPNIAAEYEKYHAKGFEVVGISLDEGRDDVTQFVADNKIPWLILFAGKGWQDPVAEFYGISGIPQLVLIGRDGNVIALDVRGEKLGAKLAELFKDAG